MREILFRGKQKDNGKWVEGDSLVHSMYKKGDVCIGVIEGLEIHSVIPKTVGQYTGLTDKNGTKIFEGDIVEGHCHSQWSHRLQRCVVVYDRDSFKSRHYLNFPNEKHYFEYKVLFSKDVVVIGNIHDNPELLKEREGNEKDTNII